MTDDMHCLFTGLRAPAVICHFGYDAAGHVTEVAALQANPAFQKQFDAQIPPGTSVPLFQLLGEKELPDWLTQEQYNAADPPIIQLRRTGVRHRVEIISLHDDRKILLLEDLTGHTIYEGNITQILSAVRDAVLFYSGADCAVVWANKAAEDLIGVDRGELQGHCSSWYLATIGSTCTCDDPVVYSFRHGIEAWTECLGRQGEDLVLHAYPVNEPDGTTSGVILTIRDISYRKKMEQQLQDALERADAANIVKDQFISNMSHELRTPLNGVIGVADLLLESDLTPQQRRFVTMVQQSGMRLHEVVQNILAFTQLEIDELRTQTIRFRPALLIRETADVFKKKAEANGVELLISIDNALQRWVIGRPASLRQIIRSLLDNAVKFTHAGSINLTATCLSQQHDDPLLRCRFTVQDTGIGIDPRFHAVLFEPFQQVESGLTRRYGGLGLGLALAQRQARTLGSEIQLQSDGKSGSTLFFDVYLQPDLPGAESAISNVYTAVKGRSDELAHDEAINSNKTELRILVAEDDRINQRVMTSILRAQGHVVEMVENGRQAIAALQQGDYELVLMDVQMPEIDGIQAVKIVRSAESGVRNPRIPVVAVTAFTAELDRTACIEAGMDGFLGKPVSVSRLMTAVQRYAIRRGTPD